VTLQHHSVVRYCGNKISALIKVEFIVHCRSPQNMY
jgi:hypothetical protein